MECQVKLLKDYLSKSRQNRVNRTIYTGHIKRIAVLSLGTPVGDTFLSIPLFLNLKKNFPDAEITAIIDKSKSEIYKTLNINLLEIEDNEWFTHIRKTITLIKKSLAPGCDLLLDLNDNPHNSLPDIMKNFCRILEPRLSIGMDFGQEYNVYKHTIRICPNDKHRALLYLDFIQTLGIPIDQSLNYDVPREYLDYAERLFRENSLKNSLVIAISPFTTRPEKEWDYRNFIALTNALILKYNAKIILLGDSVATVSGESILNMTGRTTVMQATAIIDNCRMLIGNDCGLVHIAAALNKPTISLFGPTNPRLFGPYGTGHIVVESTKQGCPNKNIDFSEAEHCGECINQIGINHVLSAVERLIS